MSLTTGVHVKMISFFCAVMILIAAASPAIYAQPASAIPTTQDERAQVPMFLQRSYFEFTAGAINYPFSAEQLQPGFQLESVDISHLAVRLVIGYNIHKYLAAQITYMRPVFWVKYKYRIMTGTAHGQISSRSVWMNYGALTLRPQLPVGQHFSIYAEGGFAKVTRHGFTSPRPDKITVVKDANLYSIMLGAGFTYQLNDKWGLQLLSTFSPANKKHSQPYTSFVGTGIKYRISPYSEQKLARAAKLGYIHPKQWIQIGMSNNVAGYGVNDFVSDIPIFWGGESEVDHGVTLSYQRNIFHGAKLFAFDWGANVSYWQTRKNKEDFFTVSVFPAIRLNFLRTQAFDAYFYYTLAGPTYVSKTILDGKDTGEKFTFFDAMATGIFFGKFRQYNAELKIVHYSNGNIFPKNEGVKIPLSLFLGYAF